MTSAITVLGTIYDLGEILPGVSGVAIHVPSDTGEGQHLHIPLDITAVRALGGHVYGRVKITIEALDDDAGQGGAR